MPMPPFKKSPSRSASENILEELGTMPGKMRAQAMRRPGAGAPPQAETPEEEMNEPGEGTHAEEAKDAAEGEMDTGPLRPDELADIRALLQRMKGGR